MLRVWEVRVILMGTSVCVAKTGVEFLNLANVQH